MAGIKHDQGKTRWELLPYESLDVVARVLTIGAAMRHLTAFWNGEDQDPETHYPHLAHAACCILFLLTYELRGAYEEFDDRPAYQPENPRDSEGGSERIRTDSCKYPSPLPFIWETESWFGPPFKFSEVGPDGVRLRDSRTNRTPVTRYFKELWQERALGKNSTKKSGQGVREKP